MTYEQIIEVLTSGQKMTMGTMIKLQRALGKKISALSKTEADIKKMNDEEQMDHQLAMLEVVSNLVFIAVGSPADLSPDAISELIPFDKVEEVSEAIGKYMNQVTEVKKN